MKTIRKKKHLSDLGKLMHQIRGVDVKERSIYVRRTKASEIIQTKLKENGGYAVVQSINGKSYEIRSNADGKSFLCDELPVTPPYSYYVFDIIVDLIVKKGGKARKGKGRGPKIGERDCDENTIVGVIGTNYFGKRSGESTYDPVFVLAAVLEWAGIVFNKRGYLELNPSYK